MSLRRGLSRLHSNKTKTRKSACPPQIEVLEPRRLLAGLIYLDSDTGTLVIKGSKQADTAMVQRVDGRILASLEYGKVSLEESFTPRDVKSIFFEGSSGDDRFQNDTNINSTALGNSGNDELIGGNGFDDLQGGLGDDILTGRGGLTRRLFGTWM